MLHHKHPDQSGRKGGEGRTSCRGHRSNSKQSHHSNPKRDTPNNPKRHAGSRLRPGRSIPILIQTKLTSFPGGMDVVSNVGEAVSILSQHPPNLTTQQHAPAANANTITSHGRMWGSERRQRAILVAGQTCGGVTNKMQYKHIAAGHVAE